MRTRVLAAGLLVAGVGLAVGLTAARADDKPLERAELDKRAAKVAYGTVYYGYQLWEGKNYDGTYRLYEGSLYALREMLDHRPKLVAVIDDRMGRAGKVRPEEGAFLLREALDAIQAEAAGAAAPAKGPVAEKKPADKPAADGKPLVERLGGEPAVRALVKAFAAAAAADPKVSLMRGRPDPGEKDLATFEGQVVDLIAADKPAETKLAGWLKVQKYTDAEFQELKKHLLVTFTKGGVRLPVVDEVVAKLEAARAGGGKK